MDPRNVVREVTPRALALAAAALIAFQIYIFASRFWIDESVLDRVGPKRSISGVNFVPDTRRPHRSADLFRVHLPNRVALGRYIQHDIIPSKAFVGEWETAAFYPLNAIYSRLPLRQGLWLEVLFHLALTALGSFLLCRSEGATLCGSLLGAACFVFSGQVYGRLYPGHLSNLATIAWVPMLLFAAKRSPLLFSVCLTYFFLAGHPQYVYFTALVFAILAALGWFRWRSAPLLLLAAGAAILLAYPQIGPALETYRDSARQFSRYSFSSSFFYPRKAWVTALDPYFFGSFDRFSYWPRGDRGTNAWEASLFFGGVGAVGLMLRGLTWRYGLAITAAALLALGSQTPLYDFLYANLPVFKSFRGVGKFSVFVALFASLAVARGFDLLWRRPPLPAKLEASPPQITGSDT